VDSVSVSSQIKIVTPGFFDIFRIDITSGAPYNETNVADEKNVIISGDRNDMIGSKAVSEIKQISEKDKSAVRVTATAGKIKPGEYNDYYPVRYYPLKKDAGWLTGHREICIRVKPEADKNFIKQFTKDMRNQLEVGHYFLASVVPFEKIREDSLYWSGYTGNSQSVYSISVFLIANIFIGIVGTFWFRTQSRKSDIGLRIALGSTKAGIRNLFIGETLVILLLASIIATIVCINITMVDILEDIGVPVVEETGGKRNISRYLINYGITFASLAIIAVIAVWYPARKASMIQPAEALKDE
jgi:putative ABC transport system permease protein